MPETFDPYAEWLGIRDPERPPNYYRLLGLDDFEERRDRIVAAADRMMAQVRRIRPGPQAALWQRMLDELAMARQCLTDPRRKSEYDGQLRARDAGWQPAAQDLYTEVAPPNPDLFPPTYRGAGAPRGERAEDGQERAKPQAAQGPIAPMTSAPQPGYAPPVAPAYQTPYVAPVTSAPVQQPAANQPAYTAPIAPPAQQQPAYGQPPYVAPVATPAYQAPYAAPVSPPSQPVYGATAMPGYPPGYQTPHAYPQSYASPAPVVAPSYQAPTVEPAPAYASPRVEAPRSNEERLDPFQSEGDPIAQPMAAAVPFAPATDQTMDFLPRLNSSSSGTTAEKPSPAVAGGSGRNVFRPVPLNPAATSPISPASSFPPELLGRPRARSNQNLMIAGVLGGTALLSIALIAMLLNGGDRSPGESGPGENANQTVATRPDPIVAPSKPQPEVTAPTPQKKPSTPVIVHAPEPKPQPPVKPKPEPPQVATVVPKPEPKPEVKPEPAPEPKPAEPKPEPAPPTKPEPKASNAERTVAFNRALRNARAAMSARDTERAKAELEKAGTAASTADQQMLLERTQTLNTYVAEFWDAVKKTLTSLQVADVITIGSTMAAVVEIGPDLLTIHVAGGNKSYTKATMPVGVARTLAERWFDAKNPTTKVFLGAFQAVDPNGDKKEAQRLWQEATLAGAAADDLIPLLDMDTSKVVIEQGPAPSASEIAAAEETVSKNFQQDLRTSFSAQKKLQVSKKLAEAAAEAETSAERYVLFQKSVDLAVEIGNAAGVVQTIDEMAQWFKIDALGMKANALLKASALANNSLVAKAITRAALELIDQAMAEQQKELAQKLAQAALDAAGKSKDAELIKQATERSEQVKTL